MRELAINNFKREVSVSYRNENYLVRDNGAVYRWRRPNKRKRPLDEIWTFGNQCGTHGYRRFSREVVHKIVAAAYHGDQPSPSHVVDHLDTNRRNNRVENLRWVTHRENIEANPKTLRRIEQKWGSVDAMLTDPNRTKKAEPLGNRSWMPQNTPRARILDKQSFTPLAMQRCWFTQNAFPLCPDEISDQPLRDYFDQLQEGSIFAHNKYGETEVKEAAFSANGLFLAVITRIPSGVKDWGLAKITFESGKFVHEAHGTFFTLEGAQKCQCELLGQVWEGTDSFDDYC